MAEALGRLCHAASSAQHSRPGSLRGSTHTGAPTGPHRAAASSARGSRSGSPGSSINTQPAIRPHQTRSSTAEASRPGSPNHEGTCTDPATASGPQAAAAPVRDTHTAAVTASSSSSSSTHRRSRHLASGTILRSNSGGDQGRQAPGTVLHSNSGDDQGRQASGTVLHRGSGDDEGHSGWHMEQDPASAEGQSQLASPAGGSESGGHSQSAQVGVPVAAAGGNSDLLSAEDSSGQKSLRALGGLQADAAAADEQLHCEDEGEEVYSSAEDGELHSSAEDEWVRGSAEEQGSAEDQQLQGSAEDEHSQGSTQDEQQEGEQTPGSASGVEGGAVGGTAGMLAALQELDAQPESPQLSADTQAVSGMHSRQPLTQAAFNPNRQSSSGSQGTAEAEEPSTHSSIQKPVDATAAVTESETQAASDRGEASGSLNAAVAVAPLLIPQVGCVPCQHAPAVTIISMTTSIAATMTSATSFALRNMNDIHENEYSSNNDKHNFICTIKMKTDQNKNASRGQRFPGPGSKLCQPDLA